MGGQFRKLEMALSVCGAFLLHVTDLQTNLFQCGKSNDPLSFIKWLNQL